MPPAPTGEARQPAVSPATRDAKIAGPIPANLINPSTLSPSMVYDYREGVLTDGDGVYEWQDQSGNARHITQATGAQKPDPPGPGVYTDGVDDNLKASISVNWASGVTVISRFKVHSCGGAGDFQSAPAVFGDASARIALTIWNTQVAHWWVKDATAYRSVQSVALPFGSFKTVACRYNGTVQMRVGGAPWVTGSTGGSAILNPNSFWLNAQWQNIRTAEITHVFHAFFPSSLTDEEVEGVENWVGWTFS